MYHNAILCAVFLAGGCVSFRYMVHNPPPPSKRSSPSSSIDGCIYRQGPVVVSKIIDFQNTANPFHSIPIFFHHVRIIMKKARALRIQISRDTLILFNNSSKSKSTNSHDINPSSLNILLPPAYQLHWPSVVVAMRYMNWDLLLFPNASRVPLQEFKGACYVTPDPGRLA